MQSHESRPRNPVIADRQISAEVIGKKLKVSTTTVYRDIKAINKVMIVYWDGPSKTGHWVMQTKCR